MNMPPITRRNFLADSAKASALLALGGSSVGSLLSACATTSSSSEASTLAVEIEGTDKPALSAAWLALIII